jgi:hypothetical protein
VFEPFKITPSKKTYNPLWDEYFAVRMLYLHSRSVEQIRAYGQRISGIPEIDRGLPKQEITTELNINAMFEQWKNGVTIRVINYDDTAKIYKIIHEHLIRFAEFMTRGVHTGAVPLEDLVKLDEFAAVVYDKAVYVFTKEERNQALSSNLANVQTFNFNNILKRAMAPKDEITSGIGVSGHEVTTVRGKNAVSEKKLPERESLKSIFEGELQQMTGWSGSHD